MTTRLCTAVSKQEPSPFKLTFVDKWEKATYLCNTHPADLIPLKIVHFSWMEELIDWIRREQNWVFYLEDIKWRRDIVYMLFGMIKRKISEHKHEKMGKWELHWQHKPGPSFQTEKEKFYKWHFWNTILLKSRNAEVCQ